MSSDSKMAALFEQMNEVAAEEQEKEAERAKDACKAEAIRNAVRHTVSARCDDPSWIAQLPRDHVGKDASVLVIALHPDLPIRETAMAFREYCASRLKAIQRVKPEVVSEQGSSVSGQGSPLDRHDGVEYTMQNFDNGTTREPKPNARPPSPQEWWAMWEAEVRRQEGALQKVMSDYSLAIEP